MKKILLLCVALVLSSCNPGALEEKVETEGNANQVAEEVVSVGGGEVEKVAEEKVVEDKVVEKKGVVEETDVSANLSDSPRHQEWVEIDNEGKTIHAFVVYPENSEKSSTVILIHENKGLNDWARSMADQVAAEGYIVVAPDLLSSFDDTKSKTGDFGSPDDATQALYSLSQEDIDSDLAAVSEYVKSIDSSNGKLVSAGFCWGGTQSFNMAAKNDELEASLVFYGTAPKEEGFYGEIDTPVFAFYGEKDDRVNATIDATKAAMSENAKEFTYEIYPGAGHAFMRNAQTPGADEDTLSARNNAFERMKDILSNYK